MNSTVNQMTSFLVMDVLERAQQLQAQGVDIIHLEVGEPDFDIPPSAAKAAQEAYQLHQTHYTHSLGDVELRREIAALYEREYQVKVNPDCIVVTSGSSPAILLLMLLLCKVGDEVLISDPGYACYRNFVLAAHAHPVLVPLRAADGFQYNAEEIGKRVTSQTAALFINSPMNPTGTLLSEQTFRQLAGLNIPIVSDEIYHGLVYEGKAHSILEYTDNAFVLNGFSKRYAMTGLRLGYLIAPKEYMPALQKMQQNFMICASSIAQQAAIAALRDSTAYTQEMLHIYDERRRYMISRLEQIGFAVPVKPQGAFYVFADAEKFTNDSLAFAFDVLEHAHVGITPGVDFGPSGKSFVRFSYANSIENIQIGLDRLEAYLATVE